MYCCAKLHVFSKKKKMFRRSYNHRLMLYTLLLQISTNSRKVLHIVWMIASKQNVYQQKLLYEWH